MLVTICWIVAMAAFGCVGYFLLTQTVPIVIFFIPIGRITLQEDPWVYWAFVVAHLLLGIAALAVLRLAD